jgi:hypothetical protein
VSKKWQASKSTLQKRQAIELADFHRKPAYEKTRREAEISCEADTRQRSVTKNQNSHTATDLLDECPADCTCVL